MPDSDGYEIVASWSPQAERVLHHPCDTYIDVEAKDEHLAECPAVNRPSLSLMDWDAVQSYLLSADGMRQLLEDCNGNPMAASLDINVLTGGRWAPGAGVVLQIARAGAGDILAQEIQQWLSAEAAA